MAKKPYSEYTDAELVQATLGKDPYADAPSSGIIRRTVGDLGVGLARGTSALLQSAQGIANLATAGGAGRVADYAAEKTGINYNDVNGFLSEYYSPEARAALSAVDKAKGFRGTLKALVDNPSSIGLYTAESAPSMAIPMGAAGVVAKGAIKRGMTAAQAATRAGIAANVGEGALSAGSVAEDIRNQGGSVEDIYKGALPAGISTTLLGKYAGKLTGGPLESVLARRALAKGADVGAMPTAGALGGAALGAVVEGTEEALQNVGEQGFTNVATGKDFLEGAGKSAALGAAVGAPMGGILGGISPQQLSTDGLNKAPIDPLGDKRGEFTAQLTSLKAQYADAVSAGTSPEDAYSVYITAAEKLKQELLTPAAVPDSAITPEAAPMPAAPPSTELLAPDEATDFTDAHVADALDALGKDATGSSLAEALITADPEQAAQLKNTIMMSAAEGTQDEQFMSMLRDALENPDVADEGVFDAALQGMRESRDNFDNKVLDDLRTHHPELVDQLETEATGAAPVTNVPKPTKSAQLKARLDPVAQAASKAAEGLNIDELTSVPKTVRASLGKKLAEATARAILGDKVSVVRGEDGVASKAGTAFAARVSTAANTVVETARRLDRLSAKVSPRITESRSDIAKKLSDVTTLLDRIKAGSASEDVLIADYKALRKSLASTKPGKRGDAAAIKHYEAFKKIVDDKMPFGRNTTEVAGVIPSLEEMQTYLKTASAGRNVTGGKTDDGGASLAELNDVLYRQIDTLLSALGAKKGSAASKAKALANLDRVVGAYKTEKYKRNTEEADGDFGEYETDEGGEATDKSAAQERNKHDRMLTMALAAYKDGRISRIKNINTGLTDSPLSSVPDRPIRKAIETGTAEDASKSPLADVYREGFIYNKDNPSNATPPGARAVLSYLAQSNTPMTRTLANMLKEALIDRMPRKGVLNPKNPLHMKFLTPEEATRLGVTSARWYNKAAYAELRKTNADMPAGGEMVLVNRATPEAILHELLHGATANWVQKNSTHETVQKLQKQLDIAVDKFAALTKDGIPTVGPLQSIYQTLDSIKRAGEQKGLTRDAARANRVAELISYAMTRASFQEFLASINIENIADTDIAYTKEEKSLLETMGNVWNAFVDVLRTLLGVKTAGDRAPARFERNREFMSYLVNRVVLINKLAAEQPTTGRGRKSVLAVDPTTDAFSNWFGASKITRGGKPKVMYHGTGADITEFKPQQAGAIFVTDNPNFAQFFAGMSEQTLKERGKEGAANIIPVYVKADKPFDYRNLDALDAVYAKALELNNAAKEDGYRSFERNVLEPLQDIDQEFDNWRSLENKFVQQAIKALGHDAFYVAEAGVRNLAVYQPTQLKSAVGNKGTYNPEAPSILDMDTLTSLDHETYTNMNTEEALSARAALPPRKRNILDRITSAPFELLGAKLWKDDSKGIKQLEDKAAEKFTEFLRAHPLIASVVGNFVEYVGVSKTAIEQLRVYMRERNSANYLGNLIEDALEGMGREDQMVFMEALTEPGKREKLSPELKQLVIDTERAILQLRDKAAASGGLAPELKGANLNEMIQYAIDRRDLATKGFSAGVIKLTKQRETANTNTSAVVWHDSTDPSSPFDNRYYPVYAKADPTKIDYFIASSQVAAIKDAGADTTASWGLRNTIGKTSVFARNKTFAEIQKAYPNVPLAHYLANTLAEMSKVVAGRQLVDNLLDINDAAATADKMVFADEAALKGAFGENVKSITWNDIELSAPQKLAARRPDYWVKVVGDKYGKLNGQYLNGSVFSAIQDMHSDTQFISSPKYNALLRFWKGTKTKLSPGTHATNMLSNVTMLYMHDIPMSALRQAANIYVANSRRAKGTGTVSAEQQKLLSLFNASGAVLGNYSQNELHRKMADAITKNMLDDSGDPGSVWSMAKAAMGYEKDKATIFNSVLDGVEIAGGVVKDRAKKLDAMAGAAYEMEDNVFRFAAFLSEYETQTGLGKSEADATAIAGRFAQYAMIDYSINARGINAMRQTLLPFLAWTYRAVPMMVRVAYTKPWKMVNLLSVYYAINALSYAALGDDGDEDKERKNLPDWMQQKIWGAGPSAYVRLPWGDKDHPVFWGAGKYLPGGDLIQSSDHGAFGMPYWPAAATPSGPAVSLIMAMSGWDSFQGRSLWDNNSSWKQNAAASLGYLTRQMMPVSPDKALYDMYRDKKGLVGNDINHMFAVSRYFGSRLYQQDAAEDTYKRALGLKAMQREFRAGLAKLARSESRYGNPDWTAVQEEQAEMAKRFMEKVSEQLGEDNG